MSDFKHTCGAEQAPLFREWIKNRGGLAIWRSADLGNPKESWTAPLNNPDGSLKPKPDYWKIASGPDLVITEAKDVGVANDVVVERIPIHTQHSSGLGFGQFTQSARG